MLPRESRWDMKNDTLGVCRAWMAGSKRAMGWCSGGGSQGIIKEGFEIDGYMEEGGAGIILF